MLHVTTIASAGGLRALAGRLVACLALGLAAGCATPPADDYTVTPSLEVRNEGTALTQLLAYQQRLQSMSAAELAHERQTLAALPAVPENRLRQAMLFGTSRTSGDLARAAGLLDGLLRTRPPEANELLPLARLLAAQYQERIKLETQLERSQSQLREAQRRRDELQEKIDALAEIERSVPVGPGGRPTATVPAP